MTDLDLTLSRLAADTAGADGGLHAAAADRVREECADPRGALLALVTAHKASDGPRLALAALIEGEGQGERAEFIRVQCELAREFPNWEGEPGTGSLFADGRYAELHRRERELLASNEDWAGPFGCGPLEWFRRGFVAAVTCSAADWLAHGDAILAGHPVERVALTARPDWRIEFRPPADRFDDYGRHRKYTALVRWGDRVPMKFQHIVTIEPEADPAILNGNVQESLRGTIEDGAWMGEEGGWWPGVAFTLPPAGDWQQAAGHILDAFGVPAADAAHLTETAPGEWEFVPPVAAHPQQPPPGIPDELIRDVAREYGLALPADAGLMRRVDTQIPGGSVYRVPCECNAVAAAQIIRPDTPVTAAPFVAVDLAPYIWVTSHGQRWRVRHGGCPNCRRVHWAATPD